jgi:hypothetical protein
MTKKTRNILILAFVIPMIGIGIFVTKFLINVHRIIEHRRTQATQKSIEEIQKAATIYQMQHAGRLPDSIADLTKEDENIERRALLEPSYYSMDAWGTPYQFEKNRRTVTITSAGSDRKFGTEDDLANE